MNNFQDFINEIKAKDFGGFNAIEYADGGQEIYLSFKALLKWINENVNLYSNGEEIIKIDWESNKPMFLYSTSVSCNLQTCYIRNPYLNTTPGTLEEKTSGIGQFNTIDYFENDTEGKYSTLLTSARNNAGVTVDPSLYPTIGNINNIYINIALLSSEMIEATKGKSETTISIREYLQNICNKINRALGSINDLQVVSDVDSEIEVLTIIDYQQKRIKGLTKDIEPVEIKAQGLGSMLTGIQAQSSITPEIATMISVGAQAQGEAVGVEATSFSKLSEGLKDRIYPTKGIGEKGKQGKPQINPLKQRFKGAVESYTKLISNQVPLPDDIYSPVALESTDESDIENIAVEFYKAALAKFTEAGQTSTAFIPIKLDFSLYGMSGMKIFQKFKLSNDVLPLSYKGDFEFIVTGISHTVDNSKWETNISALITLKDGKIDGSKLIQIPVTIPLVDTFADLTGGTDWAPIINPNKVGELKPHNAPVAIQLKAQGQPNAKIDFKKLVFIEETRGASPYYKNPATKKPGYMLHPAAAAAWKDWESEMKSKGIQTRVYSAYRNLEHQSSLSKKANGGPTVAKAGTSAHGWGMAIDLYPLRNLIKSTPAGNLKANLKARQTQIYKEIAEIGAKYNWYNPWRLSDNAGTVDEVWHFEYWGPADYNKTRNTTVQTPSQFEQASNNLTNFVKNNP